MSFFNRFIFFSFGIFIGVFIIIFSLQYRKDKIKFNYLPNSRVKNFLKNTDIIYSKKSLCKISCLMIDTIKINEYINNGTIDFKRSKIRGYEDKLYYLSFIDEKITIEEDNYLIFSVNADSVQLVDIIFNFNILFNPMKASKQHLLCEHC